MIANKQPLRTLKNRYRLLRTMECVLFAIGISLGLYSILPNEVTPTSAQLVSVLAGIAFVLFYSRRLGLWQLTEVHMAIYLNRHYPELQHSTDLLVVNIDQSTSLEQLQHRRVAQELEALIHRIKLPHNLVPAGIVFLIGIALVVVMPPFSLVGNDSSLSTKESASKIDGDSLKIAGISSVAVRVTAPAYTGIKSSSGQQLSLKVREGSEVTWQIEFTEPIDHASLIFAGKDSVVAPHNEKTAALTRQVSETSFYQIQWTSRGKTNRTDFYPIEVINDEPPVIAVTSLAQFTELKPTDRMQVELTAKLVDDYGLRNAEVVATVSKGSGESVKFREEKLRFAEPIQFQRKEENARRTIDLAKLGLEPGDELYFYIEAFDNKYPMPNKSRTETFFVAVQDTANQVAVADEGLGVDLMPEYFRSQRQIIIDSEKLLEEKKKIDKKDFNSRSNELGYDQKVLRLRYGQFLGEEFETAIARVDQTEEVEETNVVKQFGHQHDTENEHNLVDDKKGRHEHHNHKHEHQTEHDHEHHGEDEKENPFEAFVHQHDNAEEATFFIQSVKTKLRAALTLMWDAELYLRMYQPEQSLHYQHKILKLLKEISNDSRVYVHRTGFDPPPLKEEKRLSGDLSEVQTTSTKNGTATSQDYPFIRNAVAILALKTTNRDTLTLTDRTLLQRAGNELAGIAIQNPARYMKPLSDLRLLIDGKEPYEKQLASMTSVLTAMWATLKTAPASPSKKENMVHAWEETLLQELQSPLPHD